jgi:integrase
MALTMKRVAKLIRKGEPGNHYDGDGLRLEIKSRKSAHWTSRYQIDGRERWIGLGSARTFTLAEARERNRTLVRQLVADKRDPLAIRRAERAAQAAAAARTITFGEAAEAYYNAHAPGWKSAKHTAQWRATVLGKTLFGPSARGDYLRDLRPLPVAAIDTAVIIRTLEPLWHERPETMSRVRARIEAVLDWASVRGFRSGDNPATWKTISKALPSRTKIVKVKHFDAIPYAELPAFVSELRQRADTAAQALQFVILTAARTSEVIGATWSEIDLDAAVWTVAGSRMKAGKDHKVPLAPQVIELLRSLYREAGNGYVFIGSRQGHGLSAGILVRLMQRMGRSETVHGMRSAFSDWAHERTGHSNHTIEISLAHAVGSKTERAYRRGSMFDKRRALMESWATFCLSPSKAQRADNITPLRANAP